MPWQASGVMLLLPLGLKKSRVETIMQHTQLPIKLATEFTWREEPPAAVHDVNERLAPRLHHQRACAAKA